MRNIEPRLKRLITLLLGGAAAIDLAAASLLVPRPAPPRPESQLVKKRLKYFCCAEHGY
jgi:hypothetical protein